MQEKHLCCNTTNVIKKNHRCKAHEIFSPPQIFASSFKVDRSPRIKYMFLHKLLFTQRFCISHKDHIAVEIVEQADKRMNMRTRNVTT